MIIQNIILWQKSVLDEPLPVIMKANLGVWTFLFISIQILAALKLTLMLRKAQVSQLKAGLTYVMLWTVCLCVVAGCALKDMDWPSRETLDPSFFTALNAQREINAVLDDIATLFVAYHLYRINDETIQLALQIETIRSLSYQRSQASHSVNDEGSEDDELLDFIEMPRK